MLVCRKALPPLLFHAKQKFVSCRLMEHVLFVVPLLVLLQGSDAEATVLDLIGDLL